MEGSKDGMDEAIKQRVRAFIGENFYVGSESLSDTESLLDTGVVDSTGVLELLTFLEREFGLAVEDHDVVPDNLDTVERIAAFVERKRSPQLSLSA